MDISAFQYIGISIDNATKKFLVDGVANLIDAFVPLILIALTINFMVKGYLIMEGKIESPAIDITHQAVVTYCILGLAWSAPSYTTYIVGGVQALASGMSSSILTNMSEGKDSLSALDALLQMGIEQMAYCWDKVGYSSSSWVWIFVAIFIGASILMLTIISATIIIGTKFLLTILLIIGPLFFIAFCFPSTKKFFESWVGKIVENILVQFFGVTVIFLAIKIMQSFITENDMTGSDEVNPIAICAQIVVVSAILVYVIKQIPNLAGSLAGGFASQSLQAKDIINPMKQMLPRQNSEQKKNADRANSQRSSEGWDNSNNIRSGGSDKSRPSQMSQNVMDRIQEHNMKMRDKD